MATDWNEKLLSAAKEGNLQDAENAISNGADINFLKFYPGCSSCYNATAVKRAAICGHLKMVKYLLEQGANPYLPYQMEFPRESVLNRRGREDIAGYLLVVMKSKKILNRIDKDGYTPLGFCIKEKYDKKAQELIALGADVCRMDNHGKRPLIYAIEANSIEMVKMLLEEDAGISDVSALESALDLFSNEIAKILIERHPELMDADLSDGSTPLTKSIVNLNEEMSQYLIENGANVTQKDKNGKYPLVRALATHSIDTLEIIFSKCNVLGKFSGKLLNQLAEDGSIGVYKFLIKSGWDKEQTDENGKTSLALSAKHQHLILTKFLIENGADLDKAAEEVEKFTENDIDFANFMKRFLSTKKEINKFNQKCEISDANLTEKGQE